MLEVLHSPAASVTETGSATAESGTATTVASASLGPGTWMIVGCVRFPGNAKGVRTAQLRPSQGSVNINSSAGVVRLPPTGTVTMQVAVPLIVTLTAARKYYLVVQQDSDSPMEVSGSIRAVRVA